MKSCFLESESDYRQWRAEKLSGYPDSIEQLIVDIEDPYHISPQEWTKLVQICKKTNLVFYRTLNFKTEEKGIVKAIAAQVGLMNMDGNLCADQNRISSIQVLDDKLSGNYIPYTNKSLNWHTDGYYNQDQQRIRSFLMHCVQPAYSGGINSYLDPEIFYILLRDLNPNYIETLQKEDVMFIPANIDQNKEIRKEKQGPVFLFDKKSQSLYLRYTARSRNIIWKDNVETKKVRDVILDILKNNDYQFQYRLRSGEGVICNNVLHNRTSFKDQPNSTRLLYRARFYDRVTATVQEHDLREQIDVVAK